MCPYCFSYDYNYLGVADGCGDYGDDVCDTFRCEECGGEWEEYCWGSEHVPVVISRWERFKERVARFFRRFKSGGAVDDIPF